MGKLPCLLCKNFVELAEHNHKEFGKCKAFPDGIPYEHYAFMHHGDRPKECNNGIGFEPEEGVNNGR